MRTIKVACDDCYAYRNPEFAANTSFMWAIYHAVRTFPCCSEPSHSFGRKTGGIFNWCLPDRTVQACRVPMKFAKPRTRGLTQAQKFQWHRTAEETGKVYRAVAG
jgi:hypothetical protein